MHKKFNGLNKNICALALAFMAYTCGEEIPELEEQHSVSYSLAPPS